DSMTAIADRVLAAAPSRFALVGLSMGGYIAFVIAQKAPQRVARLALLDTSARPETSQQTERRMPAIALAESGRLVEGADLLFPAVAQRNRRGAAGPDGAVAL